MLELFFEAKETDSRQEKQREDPGCDPKTFAFCQEGLPRQEENVARGGDARRRDVSYADVKTVPRIRNNRHNVPYIRAER